MAGEDERLSSTSERKNLAWENALARRASRAFMGGGPSAAWQPSGRRSPGGRSLMGRAAVGFSSLLRTVRKQLSDGATLVEVRAHAMVDVAVQRMARTCRMAHRWFETSRWRGAALMAGASVASGLAMASALAVHGYVTHDPKLQAKRLAARLGSPVYSHDASFLGAVYRPVADSDGAAVDALSHGYVHLQGDPPPLWMALISSLEHQGHFNPWRNWCGADPAATLKRVLTGTGGGSSIAQMMAKLLAEPQEQRSKWPAIAVKQKFAEIGSACALHRALGGAMGIMRMAAEFGPVLQGHGGTTRGIEAGSQVLFGLPLVKASPAMLALMASAIQRPLRLTPPAAFSRGCAVLRVMDRAEAAGLTESEVHARLQCRTLARARKALKAVLPEGPEQEAALAEISAWELGGVQPVDIYTRVPATKLVNLSLRAQTLLGAGLVARIGQEADNAALPHGQALTLSFAQPEQGLFKQEATEALKQIDRSLAGGELFCVRLLPGTAPRHCVGAPEGDGQAEVLAARMRVTDGGLTRLFESSRLVWGRRMQLGSFAKLVIAVAAVRAGWTPQQLLCPRAAWDGARRLRRETRPEYGYAGCTPGQRITLREAIATSDGLAFYELAHLLGTPALRDAMQALDLTDDRQSWDLPGYALAFGTALATPGQTLAMAQAFFALAWSVPVQTQGPALVQADPAPDPKVARQLQALLPHAAQRQALRTLAEAPLSHPQGTLHVMAGTAAAAGKSGTTSSPFRPQPAARPYVQSKLMLSYQPIDQTVALVIVAGPAPQPLAASHLPGNVLQPLRLAIVH